MRREKPGEAFAKDGGGDAAESKEDGAEITRSAAHLKELDEELARAYLRWEELDH